MYFIDTVPANVTSITGIGDQNRCIIRGEDSNLTCTFIGLPNPSILWYKGVGNNSVNISSSNENYTVTETILTIHDVTDDDVDTYACEATNIVSGSLIMDIQMISPIICSK